MCELDWNFKSLQRWDSILSMTAVFRWYGCFQVRQKIQRMRLWRRSTAPRHCIPLWRVSCMPSRLTTRTLNRMQHTRWSKLSSPGQYRGCQNWNSGMGNHLFRYQRIMHTLLILNGLRKSKLYYSPWWKDTLHKVLQECGGYIDGSWHVSHWYWETPKIGMMSQDNGTMNGHSILGWILQLSDGWQTHFCQCLSMHLGSIPNLTKIKHQMRRSCTNLKCIKAPWLVYLLLKRRCYFVLFLAKFVIWSGGSPSVLQIIWIFSTCMRKWATVSAQKSSSNSKIRQIPLYS